jgi:hypothetical protein
MDGLLRFDRPRLLLRSDQAKRQRSPPKGRRYQSLMRHGPCLNQAKELRPPKWQLSEEDS